jgi:hypothetical protein
MANQSRSPLDDQLRAAHSREHVERPAGVKGGFRLSLTTGQWWWSPGMYRLHGYLPNQWASVRPSGRLLLIHRHPDDRSAFAQAWSHLLNDGGMIAVRYRIVGFDRLVRPVFAMAYVDAPARGTGAHQREVTGVMQSDGDPVA